MLLGPLAVLVCQSNKTLPGHADGKTCYRMLVSEMAVITFQGGKATLVETGPGVTVEQVVAATEAKLVLPEKIPQMPVSDDR